MQSLQPRHGDALIIVDLQYDFLPGGALAVTDGDAVIPVLNALIGVFEAAALPVVATRDWHPERHCSFQPQGGIWHPHCIAGSHGAAFADALRLGGASVVSKATGVDRDAYSGFEGTALGETLHEQGVRRVFVGGLATDYCVLQTVLDALKLGFEVVLLTDAIRAVDVQAGDGARAMARMVDGGARAAVLDDLIAAGVSAAA
ncbi:isochorismatase family protein [Massilia sp. DWR3-1-1]|uniref:isochorismatase family protein n=1 Tax=Massilia sp. DWR3-1-1 TaxID=2804559 RepID=UPI003CEB342C